MRAPGATLCAEHRGSAENMTMTDSNPIEVLTEGARTYEQKNDDYGDSWRLVGEFLWMLTGGEGVELESREDFISFGLFTRRLDKMARAFNGEFLSDELNYESVLDAHEDESVYAAMHAANQKDRQDLADQDTDAVAREPGDAPPVGQAHPTVKPDSG